MLNLAIAVLVLEYDIIPIVMPMVKCHTANLSDPLVIDKIRSIIKIA